VSDPSYERIRVLVETTERTFRGFVYKPVIADTTRLSDHLNSYDRPFLCLSDVQINDRGQMHRPGERRDFVAVAISSITYITPMREGEA
jgi:hypothetical protein